MKRQYYKHGGEYDNLAFQVISLAIDDLCKLKRKKYVLSAMKFFEENELCFLYKELIENISPYYLEIIEKKIKKTITDKDVLHFIEKTKPRKIKLREVVIREFETIVCSGCDNPIPKDDKICVYCDWRGWLDLNPGFLKTKTMSSKSGDI